MYINNLTNNTLKSGRGLAHGEAARALERAQLRPAAGSLHGSCHGREGSRSAAGALRVQVARRDVPGAVASGGAAARVPRAYAWARRAVRLGASGPGGVGREVGEGGRAPAALRGPPLCASCGSPSARSELLPRRGDAAAAGGVGGARCAPWTVR